MGSMICFALSVINIAFFVADKRRWWSAAAAVFAFGVGLAIATRT